MRSAILLCLLVTFALCELKVKPMKRVVYLRQGRGFTFPALAKMENQLYTVSSNNYGWLEVKDPNSGLSGFVHISEVQDENNRMVLPASPRYTTKIFQPPVTARKVSGGSGNVDFATPKQINAISTYNRNYAKLMASLLAQTSKE